MTSQIPSKKEMYKALEQRHGAELQKKLSKASIAVCGLGGLGSNIAISLARTGIGTLHLIDFDRVDISNLNRQQYFSDQIGIYKTEALRDIIGRIAPYCCVKTDTVMVGRENIRVLLKNDDIICEAFDKAENKAMLVNGVLEELPGKYLVSGSGMSGLHSANLIKTSRITKYFYICGDMENDVDKDGTLFASRVMLCAAHQAHAVVRIIAEKYEI